MPPNELREWLKSQPFRPFRIHLLEQTALQVNHPELLSIKLASVDFFEKKQGILLTEMVLTNTFSLRHVSRLEVLPGEVSAISNGQASL
ncbi:MAG: hypothetical protein HY040_28650 [Planctomycetes bacterium]|nr:hypothetical protein [Planctomycetota bacterium]